MQNTLLQVLTQVTPRETAGSETSARYDFQANVCVVKILELREAGQPFCAFFDYLDDLVILDSSSEPHSARFYQIKAKGSGNWTPASFCKELGAASPRSIISRMYLNVDAVKELVTSIGFISNAQFKFKLLDGKECDPAKLSIAGAELHSTVRSLLHETVVKDFSEPLHAGWADLIILERFSHGVEEQEVFVKGRIVQHLEKLDIAEGPPVGAVYDVLFNAIRARIRNVDKSQDITSLLSRKALTAEELDALFDKAQASRPSILRDWSVISVELVSQGIGSAKAIRLKTAVITYMRRCKTGASRETAFSNAAREAAEANRSAINDCDALKDAADLIATAMQQQAETLSGIEREAAILVEAYEAIHGAAE